MKRYVIELKSGSIFSGTPKEIVKDLRDSSWSDSDKPLWMFMLILSHRHYKFAGKPFNCTSYKGFVESLVKSEMTLKSTVIE